MSLVSWRDGLVRGPDGPCRQIPQHYVWSSSVWITKAGDARRRHYNGVTRTWAWDDEPLPIAFDDASGRIGYVVDHWISRERAIALAWLHRDPQSSWHLTDDGIEIELEGQRRRRGLPMAWKRGEVVEGEPTTSLPREQWRKLKWRCGLAPAPPGYMSSSLGRLRSPRGDVTRGLFFAGDRYAAVKGCGLVNLTVAAGLAPRTLRLSPTLYHAAQALMTGRDAQELALVLDVVEATAWTYLCCAAAHVPGDNLRPRARRLVAPDLWRALGAMHGDARLGGPLAELMPVVLKKVKRGGTFRRSQFQWEQLRLARLALLA